MANDRLPVPVILAAILLCTISTGQAFAEPGAVRVLDGDTLMLGDQTYRLYGIDSPELGQNCAIGEKPFDCGYVAATALMDLTAGSAVRCETTADQAANQAQLPGDPDRDKNEHLALCYADGYDLSEGMVYTGWARALPDSVPGYLSLETEARKKRHGFWKARFLKPSLWRRDHEF